MEIYRCWILFGSKEGRMGGLEMLTLDDSTGLLPLQEGEYNIEKGIRTQEEITSYIRITDSLNKVEYCPLKKPFKVYVDSVRYHESSMMPYIEGKMEGTLYNRYDVNDSIVVKDAIFGIH